MGLLDDLQPLKKKPSVDLSFLDNIFNKTDQQYQQDEQNRIDLRQAMNMTPDEIARRKNPPIDGGFLDSLKGLADSATPYVEKGLDVLGRTASGVSGMFEGMAPDPNRTFDQSINPFSRAIEGFQQGYNDPNSTVLGKQDAAWRGFVGNSLDPNGPMKAPIDFGPNGLSGSIAEGWNNPESAPDYRKIANDFLLRGNDVPYLSGVLGFAAGLTNPVNRVALESPVKGLLEKKTPTPIEDMVSPLKPQETPVEPMNVLNDLPKREQANIDIPTPKQQPLDIANDLDSIFGKIEQKQLEEQPVYTEPLQFAENKALKGKEPTNNPFLDAIEKNTIPEDATIRGQQFNDYLNTPLEVPDTSSHIVSKTEKPPLNIPASVNQSYISTIDNLYRLKQFEKTAENSLNEPLKPSEQPYTLALNSRGSDMIASQIINKNMVNAKGDVVGGSFADVTKQIPKGKEKAFEDYLVNRHAIDRMNRGEAVFPKEMNMTPEKSAQIVKNYEEKYPQFKDIAKQYDEYNNNLGKSWLVDTGLLTEEQWNKWREENPSYTPNMRKFDDIERKGPNKAKNGFVNQTLPVKKAEGSERPIISPIESTIENTEKYVKAAKRNEVGQAIVGLLEKNPEALKGFAEIMSDSKSIDVNEVIKQHGVDGLIEQLSNHIEKSLHANDPGAVVTVLKDGKQIKVKIHDMQLLDAVSALQPKAQNVVIGSLGKLTKVMKTLTTGVNPVFSLTRNVFRDIPTAFINSKTTNNPLQFAWDLADSFVSVLANKELYQSFKNIGGGHSSSVAADRNLLAQSKNKILQQQGIWNNTKHGVKRVYHMLENLNNAVESAPRLGEFKRLTKDGSYDGKVKGLYEANDVTVNFNRYGKIGKDVDSVIPYMNAAIQGLDKFVRAYKDNPVAATAKSFGAITIPTIILYYLNHDNPNFQALSNYEKDNFLNIPLPDGTFYKIPKPREVGIPFSTGVERILRQWKEQDPHAFKDFGTSVLNTFLPPIRSVLEPLNDIRANKDYNGNPIVSGDLLKRSPQYQYDTRTSELAKTLSNIQATGFKGLDNLIGTAPTPLAPKQIDYLIKSYGGVLGELGIPANTQNTSVLDTLKRQVTADPAFSTDSIRNFYDNKNKLDTAQVDFKQVNVKSDDYNKQLQVSFDNAAKDISNIRKQITKVQNSTNLSSDQINQQTRTLQLKMNTIAERMNRLVK